MKLLKFLKFSPEANYQFKHTRKMVFLFSLICLFFFGWIVFLAYYSPSKTEAAWVNDNWAYRKVIPVAAHTASESNVYETFQLDTASLITASKLQSACQDIRVTDANGKMLAYNVGRTNACNNAATTIDFLIPTMPVGAQTYYVYYGNPSATSADAGAFTQSLCGNSCSTNPTLASEETAPAPIAYWKFDDGTYSASGATTTTDSSSNAANATLVGFSATSDSTSNSSLIDTGNSFTQRGFVGDAVTITSGAAAGQSSIVYDNDGNGPFFTPSLDGASGAQSYRITPAYQKENMCISGKCLFFDGYTGNLTVAKAINNVQTIAMWVRPASVSSSALIDLDGGTHKITVSSGTISATGFTSPTIYVNGLVSSTLAADKWSFVEITTSTGFASTSSMTIGKSSTTFYKGFIDEVKIYPNARSASQVQADFNARGDLIGTSQNITPNTGQVLSNGLVGYWKFDETPSSWVANCSDIIIVDWSGYGNPTKDCPNASAASQASTRSKFQNNASFDGTNDYLDAGNGSAVQITGALTLAAWIDINSLSSPNTDHDIIAKNGDSTHLGYRLYVTNAGILKMDVSSNGTLVTTVTGGTTFATSTLYHVVGVYNPGQSMTLYVNGVQDGQNTTSIPSSINNPTINLLFGAENTASRTNFFNGGVDEVRIYNQVVAPNDIPKIYNYTQEAGMYFDLDEGSGPVHDSSGNNMQSVMTNSPTFSPGKYGKSMTFDGSTNYLNFPHLQSTAYCYQATGPGAGATIEGWVNQNSTTGSQNVYYATGSIGLNINGGTVRVFNSSNLFTNTSATTTAKTWTHIAAVFDGNTGWKTYKNGVLVSTNTLSTTGCAAVTGTTLGAGSDDDISFSGYFNGSIDDFKVYPYQINATQVVADMNAGHPAPGSPIGTPVGWWKFDQGVDNSCSGGTNDACNSGNAGSVLDGAESNMAVPSSSTSGWTQSGKFGKALIFDGSNDTVNAGSDTAIDDLTANPVTLSAWINPVSMGESSQGVIMAKNSGATPSSGWLWQFTGTNALKFSVDGSTDLVRTTSNNVITLGAWNYVTLTWNGTFTDASKVHMYVNGIETTYQTTTNGATRVSDASSSLFIGNDSSGASTFEGTIDEPKIYTSALAQNQINLDMNYGQSQQLGAAGNNTTYQTGAANQEYCVPGDTTSCASPTARWDFEEGTSTTARDTSGNGLNGTLTDIAGLGTQTQPLYKPGKIGKGLNFDGTDDYVNMGDPASGLLDFGDTDAFTLEAWTYRRTVSTDDTIIDKKNNTKGATGAGYQLLAFSTGNGGNICLYIADGGSDGGASEWETCTTDVATGNTNTWVHVAAVFDPASQSNSKIYVNGVRNETSTTGTIANIGSIANAFSFQVGVSSNSQGEAFDGAMDQVRVFRYARTPAQIDYDYNKGAPVAWWKLDDCQGTTINDSSGNSNIGTKSGSSTTGTCTTSSTFWGGSGGTGAGKRNYAPTFNGTNDVIRRAETATTDLGATTDSYSLAAWFKTSSTYSTNGDIIAKDIDGTAPYPYRLYIDTSQHVCFDFKEGTNNSSICGSKALNDGNWHHVVAIRDVPNDQLHLYVDGAKAATDTTDISTTTVANNDDVSIGNGGASTYTSQDFTGQIDDARIYNYPLTSTQVGQIMNNGAINFAPATGAP